MATNYPIYSHPLRAKVVMLKGATGSPGTPAGSSNTQNFRSDTYVIYVDGTNGNDDNNGSSADPFKTLTKALQQLNTQGPNAIIHLKTAGTYSLNYRKLNNTTVRINGDVSGVVVNLNNTLAVNNCYLDIRGISFIGHALDVYGGYFYAESCSFGKVLTLEGANFELRSCTIFIMTANKANGKLINLTINGEQKTDRAITIRDGSSVAITGNFTLQQLSAVVSYSVILLWDATLMFTCTVDDQTVAGAKYAGSLDLNNGILHLSTTGAAGLLALGSISSSQEGLVTKGAQRLGF